jgi:hypothetical protein
MANIHVKGLLQPLEAGAWIPGPNSLRTTRFHVRTVWLAVKGFGSLSVASRCAVRAAAAVVQALDGDERRLVHNGVPAARDIVQFVPLSKLLGQHQHGGHGPPAGGVTAFSQQLATQLLAELPQQVGHHNPVGPGCLSAPSVTALMRAASGLAPSATGCVLAACWGWVCQPVVWSLRWLCVLPHKGRCCSGYAGCGLYDIKQDSAQASPLRHSGQHQTHSTSANGPPCSVCTVSSIALRDTSELAYGF